jgi:hypothetical protein
MAEIILTKGTSKCVDCKGSIPRNCPAVVTNWWIGGGNSHPWYSHCSGGNRYHPACYFDHITDLNDHTPAIEWDIIDLKPLKDKLKRMTDTMGDEVKLAYNTAKHRERKRAHIIKAVKEAVGDELKLDGAQDG